ncbi:MAG: HupE/UreJ family protein [Planctomycetota bacterium]
MSKSCHSRVWLRRTLFLWCLVILTFPAWAHDPGLSQGTVTLADRDIRMSLSLANEDFQRFVAPPPNGSVTVNDVDLALVRVAPAPSNGVILRFRSEITATEPLRINASFIKQMARGHRLHLTVISRAGNPLGRALLSAESSVMELDSIDSGNSGLFGEFLQQGVWHILIGVDHLAFMLLLILPLAAKSQPRSGHWRSLLTVITAFTVGHSVSLSLAGFDLVRLPGGPVEAAIAASIVVAGVMNLHDRWAHASRWLTLPFGLIHGLGFASVLAEIRPPPGELVTGLLAFNIGVEFGQLAIILIAWPLLRLVGNISGRETLLVQAGSLAVAAMGGIWFVDRLGGSVSL